MQYVSWMFPTGNSCPNHFKINRAIGTNVPLRGAREAYAIRPYPGTSHLFSHPYMYPAKFPGLGEALIFFCFFSSIKGRKEDHSKAEKNAYSRYRLFVSYQKTPKGRMQYAPTACRPMGFGFILPQVPVKPAGFHSDLWKSPKPAGFYAMSCSKAQNPPGFVLCRVAECKTYQVSGGRGVLYTSPGCFR